jgi:hypothetical protein
MLFSSIGKLHYDLDNNGLYKLIVLIDPAITSYYRALIPKYRTVHGQRHAPHISVIRKEPPQKLEFWGKYEDRDIEFHYDNMIQCGTVYYWLNVFSKELEEIRVELGLPIASQYTLPPEGWTKCFHTTLGNCGKK